MQTKHHAPNRHKQLYARIGKLSKPSKTVERQTEPKAEEHHHLNLISSTECQSPAHMRNMHHHTTLDHGAQSSHPNVCWPNVILLFMPLLVSSVTVFWITTPSGFLGTPQAGSKAAGSTQKCGYCPGSWRFPRLQQNCPEIKTKGGGGKMPSHYLAVPKLVQLRLSEPEGPKEKLQCNAEGAQKPPFYCSIPCHNCQKPPTGGRLTIKCGWSSIGGSAQQLGIKRQRLSWMLHGKKTTKAIP